MQWLGVEFLFRKILYTSFILQILEVQQKYALSELPKKNYKWSIKTEKKIKGIVKWGKKLAIYTNLKTFGATLRIRTKSDFLGKF